MTNKLFFRRLKFALKRIHKTFVYFLITSICVSCEKKLPHEDHMKEVDRIIQKVDSFDKQGLTVKALKFLDSAFLTIPNPGPIDLLKKHHTSYGYFFYKKKNPALAIFYLDSMLLAVKDYKYAAPYKLHYLDALLLNAEARLVYKNYPGAYKYYLKAKKYVEESQDPKLEAEFYKGMGMANYLVEEYVLATVYLKKALSILPNSSVDKSYDAFWARQSLLNTMGLAFEKLTKNDSALVYYQNGCDFIEKHRTIYADKKAQLATANAVIMGNMILPYYRIGDAAAAESMAKKSLYFNQVLGYDKVDAQTAMIKLGRIYLAQNRLVEAEALIDTLKASIDLRKEPLNQKGLFELCSDYYEKKGDFKQAFVYFKKNKVLGEKLELENNGKMNIDLDKEIDALQRKESVDLLIKKTEENNIIIVLAVVIVLLAILTIILLWRNWKQSKKSILSLTTLNSEIQSKNSQLEGSIKLLDVSQTLGETAGWEHNYVTNELFITKQTYLLYDLGNDFTPTMEGFKTILSEHEQEILDQITEHILKEADPYHLIAEITTAKKVKKWVRIIAEPLIKNNAVVGSIGALQDITVAKKAEQELLSIKETLEQNIIEKDQIMNMLIHDLISPLSGIQSLTNLLIDKNIVSSPDQEILNVINKTSLLLVEMINDLVVLYLSSENNLLKKETNIRVLLQQCTSIMKHKADEKNQQIYILLETDLFAYLDAKKMHRALANLIGNAIKFSANKSSINLYAKKEDGLLKLTIEDRGIGIPEELHSQLFDTFTTSRRYGTNGEQPLGLGLSITKKIVEAHGGKIWFQTQPDKGTTFFVEIPSD